MTTLQIEAWAREVIERVQAGHVDEDCRVELKREFPVDHRSVARQLAGLANAALHEPVMFIVGVDQKTGETYDVVRTDLATWWPQVEKNFQGASPAMRDHIFKTDDGSNVSAMVFDTDAAPFIVKTGLNGGPTLEVPWRAGTSTRSATRGELLKMLMPLQRIPDIDVVSVHMGADDVNGRLVFTGDIAVYVIPKTKERVVIASHLSDFQFQAADDAAQISFRVLDMQPGSPTIDATNTEMIIDGPGRVRVRIRAEIGASELTTKSNGRLYLSFGVIAADRRVSMQVPLHLFTAKERHWGWSFP